MVLVATVHGIFYAQNLTQIKNLNVSSRFKVSHRVSNPNLMNCYRVL
jgi:hypothetical protein